MIDFLSILLLFLTAYCQFLFELYTYFLMYNLDIYLLQWDLVYANE